MQLFTWLSKWITGGTQTQRAPTRKQTSHFRPQLETLEGRDVPSTLTVTSAADSGAGSLRADIAAANPGDTINFAPSLDGQTIKLTSGLVVNKSLNIQGPGASELTISDLRARASFTFQGAATNATLSGLTISHSFGLINSGSTLTINNCTLSNNTAIFEGEGGAIANVNGGALTINGCTLSGNSSSSYGGAVYNSGATLNILNSTLSGNQAMGPGGDYGLVRGEGGAIYSNSGTVSITNCTLSNNSAEYVGGAIFNESPSTMTVNGCTFSGNVEDRGYAGDSVGNDIYNYANLATSLTISNSVFSNHYSGYPIQGPWTNGGGNTFNY
jgi:hypothetical protein